MAKYVCKQRFVPNRNKVSQYHKSAKRSCFPLCESYKLPGLEPNEWQADCVMSGNEKQNRHKLLSTRGITNSYENTAIKRFFPSAQ